MYCGSDRTNWVALKISRQDDVLGPLLETSPLFVIQARHRLTRTDPREACLTSALQVVHFALRTAYEQPTASRQQQLGLGWTNES